MRPLAPVDSYIEAQPLLRHIRVMEKLYQVIDATPETRKFLPGLHGAYMDILNEELAPDALTLALALTQLEDAYPEIDQNAVTPLPKD